MRIIFMGTPDFAEESLNSLIGNHFDVIGVFSQPDKPQGRGMEIKFSPVKTLANKYNIPVFQPESLNSDDVYNIITDLNPDILVVVAYGKLIPDRILEIPKFGAINVHGSLLPKYRGAAPIQWSILNGDEFTGVSTMYLSHDMDCGDIIYSQQTNIGLYETSGELFDRLKVIGAELLVKTLNDINLGIAPRISQDNSTATYTKQLDKSYSPIDWNKSSKEIIKQIYGLQPWPVATATIDGNKLKIYNAILTNTETKKSPGSIVKADNNGIEIACGDGLTILLKEVQAAGKRRMSTSDYLRGHPIKEFWLCMIVQEKLFYIY